MSKENIKLKEWLEITPYFENYMKKNKKKLKKKIRKGKIIQRFSFKNQRKRNIPSSGRRYNNKRYVSYISKKFNVYE